jgi:lipopolysaccharide export system protein LptC
MTDLARVSSVPGRRLDLPVRKTRRAIRVARLHSVFVRYLRQFIVFGCSLAVLGIGIVILFDPFKRLPHNLSIAQVGLQGSLVTLKTPKTTGFRADGRPFELEGVSGTQDLLNSHVVNLVGVNAKIGLDDATTARITAAKGIYDSNQDIVWLRNNVRIKNDIGGYDMHLMSATVDLNSSALITKEPVLVTMNNGSTITANSMDIGDSGHKITFEGQVNSSIVAGDAGSAAEEAAQ